MKKLIIILLTVSAIVSILITNNSDKETACSAFKVYENIGQN